MTADWTREPGVAEAVRERDARQTFDPEALAAALHQLTTAVDAVNRAAMGSEVLPWTDAVTMLDALRAARMTAQTIEANMELRAAKAMAAADVKATEVPGVGFVEWRRGRDRKSWAHDALARDVVDAHMRETGGEVPDPYTVRDWLLAAAHVDYWRTTALRGLDLDAEDYAVSTPGKLSVQITRPG